MNEEQKQQFFAEHILFVTLRLAEKNSEEQDVSAATVAILMRAFELATQDLSVERRNKLLKGEWE